MADFKQLLDAVGTALGVIENVTNLPGIELIPYVATVSKVIKYAKIAVDAGGKIAPYAEALVETFSGGLPSEEKRAALDARMETLHAKIQGFTPVAEPGEPE